LEVQQNTEGAAGPSAAAILCWIWCQPIPAAGILPVVKGRTLNIGAMNPTAGWPETIQTPCWSFPDL